MSEHFDFLLIGQLAAMSAAALSSQEEDREAFVRRVVFVQRYFLSSEQVAPAVHLSLEELRRLTKRRVNSPASYIPDKQALLPPYCFLARVAPEGVEHPHLPILGELLLGEQSSDIMSPFCRAMSVSDEWLTARMGWRSVYDCVLRSTRSCVACGWEGGGRAMLVGPWKGVAGMVWNSKAYPVHFAAELEKSRRESLSLLVRCMRELKTACARKIPRAIFQPVVVDGVCLSIEEIRLLRDSGVRLRREIINADKR